MWPLWATLNIMSPSKRQHKCITFCNALYPWPEAHLEGNFEPKPGLGRVGLRQALLAHDTLHELTTISQPIPDRSSPGSKSTAPSVAHQEGGEKYATGVTTSKIRARNNVTIGTWNLRTLRIAGKLEELSYEMSRYDGKTLGRHPLRRVINYTPVARRTNPNTALDFLCRRTSWTLSWAAVQSQAGLLSSAWGQVHLTSRSYRPTPLPRSMMMMQLRTSMTTCRKSWTSPLRKTSLLC